MTSWITFALKLNARRQRLTHTVSLNDGSASLTFRNERSNSLDELTLQALTVNVLRSKCVPPPAVSSIGPSTATALLLSTRGTSVHQRRENPSCEKEKDKRWWNKKIEFKNKLGLQDVRAAKTKVLLSCKVPNGINEMSTLVYTTVGSDSGGSSQVEALSGKNIWGPQTQVRKKSCKKTLINILTQKEK
ncbi:hypothetical protein CBL_08565 [Carabus blaptoides fortunei]